MKKAVFESIDWSWVQPGLSFDANGTVAGIVALADATGAPAQCEVELRMYAVSRTQERLEGTVRHRVDAGEPSFVTLQLQLDISDEEQSALLHVAMQECAPVHKETSEALAAATTLVHWTVLALARRWGRHWVLRLELGDSQTDRVNSRLLDELGLAAELAAEALEGWACCLVQAGGVD